VKQKRRKHSTLALPKKSEKYLLESQTASTTTTLAATVECDGEWSFPSNKVYHAAQANPCFAAVFCHLPLSPPLCARQSLSMTKQGPSLLPWVFGVTPPLLLQL
jgi:hypothetical protein